MPWIIDTDIFIEGERGHPSFIPWLESADGVATADVVRGEFLIGVHAVADAVLRQRGIQFTPRELPACRRFLQNLRITAELPRWPETRAALEKANPV